MIKTCAIRQKICRIFASHNLRAFDLWITLKKQNAFVLRQLVTIFPLSVLFPDFKNIMACRWDLHPKITAFHTFTCQHNSTQLAFSASVRCLAGAPKSTFRLKCHFGGFWHRRRDLVSVLSSFQSPPHPSAKEEVTAGSATFVVLLSSRLGEVSSEPAPSSRTRPATCVLLSCSRQFHFRGRGERKRVTVSRRWWLSSLDSGRDREQWGKKIVREERKLYALVFEIHTHNFQHIFVCWDGRKLAASELEEERKRKMRLRMEPGWSRSL